MMEDLEYKGILPRFLAFLIDGIILSAIFVFANMILFSDPFPIEELYLIFGLYLLIQCFYFTLQEGLIGYSIGKRALKLKVLNETGEPAGIGAALVRNFLRLVDMLPILYLIAVILIIRSIKKQRLGDKMAGTIVVGKKKKEPEKKIGDVGFSKHCINCGMKMVREAVYCPGCGVNQPSLDEE